MCKWIVFYDREGNELTAYTEVGSFPGEQAETIALLAYEKGIPIDEIIVKEEIR